MSSATRGLSSATRIWGCRIRPPGRQALLLDLHVPDGPGPFAAAILIHGGGFDEGSKSTNVRPLFEPLTDAGFAWFSIDYRLAPAVHFPEAMEDVNSAIRWVKAHAAEYRVDVSRIAIIGESAGGFFVNYAGTHETPATKVAAVVDFYGPSDYGKLALLRREHPERFNMATINRHAAMAAASISSAWNSLMKPAWQSCMRLRPSPRFTRECRRSW
jgi:acetyl esterase